MADLSPPPHTLSQTLKQSAQRADRSPCFPPDDFRHGVARAEPKSSSKLARKERNPCRDKRVYVVLCQDRKTACGQKLPATSLAVASALIWFPEMSSVARLRPSSFKARTTAAMADSGTPHPSMFKDRSSATRKVFRKAATASDRLDPNP